MEFGQYVTSPGAPLLSVGAEQNRGVSCFIVRGDRLVFLRRSDFPEVIYGPTAFVISRQLEPTPAGASTDMHIY